MKEELQLRLQAYLDGELSSGDAREVTDLLAQDAEARALLGELKNTHEALAGFESGIKLPETREFYWSKIEREIRRVEEKPAIVGPSAPFLLVLRRLLVPTAVVAALVIAVSLMGPHPGIVKPKGDAEMETAFADADAFTYRDYSGGTTLIWLSYPAEKEFAEPESGDILD